MKGSERDAIDFADSVFNIVTFMLPFRPLFIVTFIVLPSLRLTSISIADLNYRALR